MHCDFLAGISKLSLFRVRIGQRVGYELIESGYETSEPGYESSGYERSMGMKRIDTLLMILIQMEHLFEVGTYSRGGGGGRAYSRVAFS